MGFTADIRTSKNISQQIVYEKIATKYKTVKVFFVSKAIECALRLCTPDPFLSPLSFSLR